MTWDGKSKGIHLNGNKGWLTVLCFVLLNTGAMFYWGGSISAKVEHMNEDLKTFKRDVKEEMKEINSVIFTPIKGG